MRRIGFLLGSIVTLGGAACSGPPRSPANEPAIAAAACPPHSLYEPMTGACAAVVDARLEEREMQALLMRRAVPNLGELRAARTPTGLPVPGGIGTGTIWRQGLLPALTFGALYTKMTVHPEGIPGVTDFLFTTATNRTQKTVEVVGIYQTNSAPGAIGIFDWSCSPNAPCAGMQTGPSWIWTRPFTEISCNYTLQDPGDGHPVQGMYYVNQSDQKTTGGWENFVWFWNYCTSSWDLVYVHDYVDTPKDCRDSSCGWWGPILETFMNDPQPPISELDFWDGLLLHDGIWSSIGPDETDFTLPHPPWNLFFRNPNRAWGAGNYTPPPPPPPCLPHVCHVGDCGAMDDGCGGTWDCGPCRCDSNFCNE